MTFYILSYPLPLILFIISAVFASLACILNKNGGAFALASTLSAAAAVASALICGVPLIEIFTCLLIIILTIFISMGAKGDL